MGLSLLKMGFFGRSPITQLNSEFSSARQRVSERELVCLSHVISNRHMSPAPPIIPALTTHPPPVSMKYATLYQLIYLEILID